MNPEAYEQLGVEVIDWLQTATSEQVLEYARGLGDQANETISALRSELLSHLRVQRRWGIEDRVHSNACQVLPESKLLRFLVDLSEYNPESVCMNYKKLFPALTFSHPDPEVGQWADWYLDQWQRVFQLLTAPQLFAAQVEFRSLLRLNRSADELEVLYHQLHQGVQDVVTFLAGHNFEAHALPAGQQTAIYEALKSLTFFPDEYCTRLARGKVSRELYELLNRLLLDLQVVGRGVEVGADLANEQAMVNLLWDELVFEEQRREVERYEENVFAVQGSTETSSVATPLFSQLLTLLQPRYIQDGRIQHTLRQYLSTLTLSQKHEFLAVFERACIASLEVNILFEPVDPEYFLDQIKSQSLPGSKVDFINSLEPKVLPEYWPVTQKLMLMIASLY